MDLMPEETQAELNVKMAGGKYKLVCNLISLGGGFLLPVVRRARALSAVVTDLAQDCKSGLRVFLH